MARRGGGGGGRGVFGLIIFAGTGYMYVHVCAAGLSEPLPL